MRSCKVLLLCMLALLPAAALAAPVPAVIQLWQGPAPDAKGNTPADIPTLTSVLPAQGTATGAAVIVCPGGGYQYLAKHEGLPPAQFLAGLGITAFVLKYRIAPRYHYEAIHQDVMRAMRLVRYNAAAWGLDPQKIGIMGFSAGGHLAAMAATCWDNGNPVSSDPIDRVSSRPDAAMLIYPVITMRRSFTHMGSRINLIGSHPAPAMVQAMSLETRVNAQTPPCFLVCTADDPVVPAKNSLEFALACWTAHVPVELHMYEHGPHGYGLAEGYRVLSRWPSACALWLQKLAFAAAPKK